MEHKKNCFEYLYWYIYIIWNYVLIYTIAACYLIKEQLFQQHKKPTNIGDCDGKVSIVTGGNRGIGLETVKKLMDLNMNVIIGSRIAIKKEDVEELCQSHRGSVKLMELDLANWKSIYKFVADFEALGYPLHLLVNNAGIMFAPQNQTADGFECHWGVNYLGHVLLTYLLLDKLTQSGTQDKPSRIVNVASCVHYIGSIKFDDINSEKYYSAEASYAQSKLAIVIFSKMLSNKLRTADLPVIINSVHPGVVMTQLYENVTWFKLLPYIARLLLMKPIDGCDTIFHASVSEDVSEGGFYYENCSKMDPYPSDNPSNIIQQELLWNKTCQQLDIKFNQLLH